MANFLSQFQSIKNSCDRLIIAIDDVSDLWPLVKEGFEKRLPFKRATLNNKTRNPVTVDNLPAEFILASDQRVRSRFLPEQPLFWFKEPYATVVLVTCEDLDEFKTILKPRLKLTLQNDEKQWFIVFVSKAAPNNDQAYKMAQKVYGRLEVDFNSRKRERTSGSSGAANLIYMDLKQLFGKTYSSKSWSALETVLIGVFSSMRMRFVSSVNNVLCLFGVSESLAFMFEMAHLNEESLREYDELELCYLETVNNAGKQREFGGIDHGDDQAAILNPNNKQLSQIVQDDSFREFEFRQYLFSCQAKLLFKLKRPFEVASRGFSFIVSFSEALALRESGLPFCMREVWVLTASLGLVNATADHYKDGIVAPEIEKEFYRVKGELYTLCRVKFMRLAYLLGYGSDIERSPVNSASLSMLPWPKPAVWPSVPPDAASEVLVKEKMMQEATPRIKHFGIQKKPLPLEPSFLLHEANRQKSSCSADSEAQSSQQRKLAEVFVASQHALRKTISDPGLWNSLSSLQEFEKKYLELSKGAADNYHHSWWKRHGVVLDGEIASVCFKNGNHDLAAKSYEKVCALYSGEGWHDLLADVLPNLAECQKILNDRAGYLSSCVRLLSLDKGLFLTNERQAFQSEVVRLAHSEMEDPVPLDVSSLITFSGNSGPPMELCDGDPGSLSVTLWCEFPDDITLESLSLTLTATNNADECVKAIRSGDVTILKPGRNTITLSLPPQKPGSYVLGVLTGQIGHLRFRSHGFSRGGPADSDDLMSYDKPTRPILKVFKPRSLVDLSAKVSSALLMNEAQWVGIIVKPFKYSLKGAVLHINTGPGLKIEESHDIEMETHFTSDNDDNNNNNNNINNNNDDDDPDVPKEFSTLTLKNGSIELPDWASNIVGVLWIPVRAINEGLPKGTSAGVVLSQRANVVDGLRTLALKLEFGVSRNQIFEKTVAAHFTDPFHVSTRVADKGNDGALLLQVILQSQVKASLTIHDAWLDLQDGSVHDGKPTSALFPLIVPPASRAGILFDEEKALHPDTILNIKYKISGDRNHGSHTPVSLETKVHDNDNDVLTFRSSLELQRPVLEPSLAVGFLPLPSNGLRVGQLFTMKWRIERLKFFKDETASGNNNDEVVYEVKANLKNWMIAGRKRGHAPLSTKQGSRIEISILCVPLGAGYVRPPQLELPNVNRANIICNPAGPHLVCVLPPPLSSSFCIPA
ncbi:unnamed protein product [Lactuca virosa]|uniref:Trafficking protein particle complex subunit 11 domain-containing protein n=1 Tax=Lactuca virosa TaxID=75947 RepID=A0AAU9PCA5_9ASTR|nr:unnamed protein product [Lactuca virosa]